MTNRNFSKVVTGFVQGSRWQKQVAVAFDGTCSVVTFSQSGAVNHTRVSSRIEAANVMSQIRNGRSWNIRVIKGTS